MSLHRFHFAELATASDRMELGPEETHHAVHVLRLRGGERVELFDGMGRTAEGTVVKAAKSGVVIDRSAITACPPPAGPHLTIVTALPRSQRQQFLFEKCTELGVRRIVPCISERSTVKPKAASLSKWQRITIEAGKQSGCSFLPEIETPSPVTDTFRLASDAKLPLLAAVRGDAALLEEVLVTADSDTSVVVWIGPEGGFSEPETAALVDLGAKPISLGANVLRVETAALVVAAVCAARRRERPRGNR